MSDGVRPRWTQSRWAVPVLGILLFFNLLLFVANQQDLLSILVALPQPVATLIAGIVGLGTIAWQTRRGFDNLIKSQEHRAKLDEDARLHQATLSEIQRDKEIDRSRKMLAGALRAELVAGLTSVGEYYQLFEMQAMYYKNYPDHIGKIMVGSFSAPIYKENISRLELLGPSIAADVIMVFSKANIAIEPEKLPESDGRILETLFRNAAASQKELLQDIYHVCDRLKFIEFGSPDPGPLIAARLKREKTKGEITV